MNLERHRRDWEDIAGEDPLWAILSDESKGHGGWDLDQFFATGRPEIERVMQRSERLALPRSCDLALDFGCGYGRTTRAISAHFASTVGVDIAEEMVQAARRLNASYPGIEFIRTESDDLREFAGAEFDFLYSNIVLQHQPDARVITRYVEEFVRVLRPGGLLVFQLPTAIPPRYRLQPRRRAYALLRSVGVSAHFLRDRLNLHPIRMSAVPERTIVEVLEVAGARVLEIDRAEIEGFGIPSNTYWATR